MIKDEGTTSFVDDEGRWYKSEYQSWPLFQIIAGQAKKQLKVRDGKVYIHHDWYVGYPPLKPNKR